MGFARRSNSQTGVAQSRSMHETEVPGERKGAPPRWEPDRRPLAHSSAGFEVEVAGTSIPSRM
jgi:hypothetical protein